MIGRLQYSLTGSAGSYIDLATIRPQNGRDYKVEAITGKNRSDDVEVLAYKVKVNILTRSIPATALDYDEFYWRIYFSEPDRVKHIGGKIYECINSHISETGTNEPGTGTWPAYWIEIKTARKNIDIWYNSVNYYDSYEIELGQRKYTYDFDANLKIHEILSHKVGIEFIIPVSSVDDYTEPVGIS